MKDVHIYHKSAFEPWDYRTPETTGIGGSEIAQIEIGSRLANRGYNVTQYANTPEDSKWKHWKDANFNLPGYWIIMRQPNALDEHKVRNDQDFSLLCEDVEYFEGCGGAFTEERAKKFNRIIALCPSHLDYLKKRFPFLKDKLVLSSNGIKTNKINDEFPINNNQVCEYFADDDNEKLGYEAGFLPRERDPYRIIWASSPDRGLKCLLQIFKKAHEFEPRLNLHCYYGFDNWDKVINAYNEKNTKGPKCPQEVMKDDIVKWLDQPGVIWHGRTNQRNLWKAFSEANFWVYPTWFPETSCITCMEAQALGTIPITTPFWAVGHNVQHGVFVAGDPTNDKMRQLRYADWLIKLSNAPSICEQFRSQMIPWARTHFDWELIINQYEDWFKNVTWKKAHWYDRIYGWCARGANSILVE